jgi:hypothetical protein
MLSTLKAQKRELLVIEIRRIEAKRAWTTLPKDLPYHAYACLP